MKKILILLCLLCFSVFAYSKQYVYLSVNYVRLTKNGKLHKAAEKCKELIAEGYRIVCVNTDEDSFLIVYEDKDD